MNKSLTTYGVAMLELIIALSVLMVALGVGSTALTYSISLKKTRAKRDAAREAVGICLERLRTIDASALPSPSAGPEATRELGIPPDLRQVLPGAKCLVAASSLPENKNLRRLRVEIRWPESNETECGEIILRVPNLESSGKK